MIHLAVRIVVLCQYFYSLRGDYLLDRVIDDTHMEMQDYNYEEE